MVTVPLSKLSKADRYPYFAYNAEASELGFPVGKWPLEITVPTLGNGQPFVMGRPVPNQGGYVYFQRCGCLELTVFND